MKSKPPPTLILEVRSLDHNDVVRTLEVRRNYTLYDLAEAITKAFDFSFDHCFGYYNKRDEFKATKAYELFVDIGGEPLQSHAQSVKHTTVNELWKRLGQRWYFIFDYGQMWEFTIKLTEKCISEIGGTYPKLLTSEGIAPEQYPDCQLPRLKRRSLIAHVDQLESET